WIICRALGQFLPNNTTNLANIAVSSPAWGDLRESLPTLPPWFDFSLDLAGVTLVSSNNLSTVSYRPAGKGSGQTWQKVAASPTEVLATARRFDRGIDLLRLNIHLVSPEMLSARQQARRRLFGLLIRASTV